MKQLILILLTIHITGCFTDSNENKQKDLTKNDYQKQNLKGAVKLTETWNYIPLKDSSGIKRILKGGELTNYNNAGFISSAKTFDKDKKITGSCDKKYNDEGFCTESKSEEQGTKKTDRFSYTDNNLTVWTELINDKEVRKANYSYDEQGRENQCTESYPGADYQTRKTHKYDQNGNRTETLIYDETDNLNLKYFYKYDDSGREIMQTIFTGENVPGYRKSHNYDKKGNVIEEKSYAGSGEIISSESVNYSYEYDDLGNWIKKSAYGPEGVEIMVSERHIEYYE
jgi:hypothetical protein